MAKGRIEHWEDYLFLASRFPNLFARLTEDAPTPPGSDCGDFDNWNDEEWPAYSDGGFVEKPEEDLDEKEEGREEDEEYDDLYQAPKDLLFGILRDWTHIAAGLPGPWTEDDDTPLGKLLSHVPETFEREVRNRFTASIVSRLSHNWFFPNPLTRIRQQQPGHQRRVRAANERPSSGNAGFLMPRSRLSPPRNPQNNIVGTSDSGENNITDSEHHSQEVQPDIAEYHFSELSVASNPDHPSEVSWPRATPAGNNTTDPHQNIAESQSNMAQNQFHMTEHNPAQSAMASKPERHSDPTWLKATPVEVFAHIASFLSRDDLKACLETSPEFNRKFGPSFFDQVVLPFDTETFDPVQGGSPDSFDQQQQAPKLPMFENWDELLRAQQNGATRCGTLKPSGEDTDQGFYPTVFTWPERISYVDPSTEKLELAAQKVKPIQDAIARLTNLDELALSIDSGLGYLAGPDGSDRAKIFSEKTEIFGRKYAQSREQVARDLLEALERKISQLPDQDKRIFEVYEKCLQIAFPHDMNYIHIVVDYMMKYERDSLRRLDIEVNKLAKQHMVDSGLVTDHDELNEYEDIVNIFKETIKTLKTHPIPPNLRDEQRPHLHSERSSLRYHKQALKTFDRRQKKRRTRPYGFEEAYLTLANNLDRGILARILSTESTLPTESTTATGSATATIFNGIDISQHDTEDKVTALPITPNKLTSVQQQWLKEMGWVQQAFLTSFLTSIITNKTNLCTIRTLNLAKISTTYLSRLNDADFWSALPELHRLTIMAAPEWRDIVAGYQGEFSSHPVNPSKTVCSFYKLLTLLSSRASIKVLTLGYIGGGEHATGLFARNKHILPAPIVDNSSETSIVTLPHLKQLTFQNCWFVPEILDEFISAMEESDLLKVKFESVSLIAAGGKSVVFPFAQGGWHSQYPPRRQHNSAPLFVGFGVPQPSEDNLAAESAVIPPLLDSNGQPCMPSKANWQDQRPKKDTWSKFIDKFTPGLTAKERQDKDLSPSSLKRKRPEQQGLLQTRAKEGKIPHIEFISCGYAKLEVQNLGATLNNLTSFVGCTNLSKRKDNLAPYMMSSIDPFLAEILPAISQQEDLLLTKTFGMRLGWGDDHRKWWNGEDGKQLGGTGRFSGVVRGEQVDDVAVSP